ncbi:hypothetical protein [Cohnella fermenti]|uniref:hypothetical protein n=1 Tax=Cohnella fermenti TaxID=2565925 RepID=UPI001454B9D5|nr:hypothetical protein [Cohnella fermenti]
MEQDKTTQELHGEEKKTKDTFERFMSASDSLSDLDLTDIEPIMPPTYKASRYRAE